MAVSCVPPPFQTVLVAAEAFHVGMTWPIRPWISAGLIMPISTVPILIRRGEERKAAVKGILHWGTLLETRLATATDALDCRRDSRRVLWLALCVLTLSIGLRTRWSEDRQIAIMLVVASVFTLFSAGNSYLAVHKAARSRPMSQVPCTVCAGR